MRLPSNLDELINAYERGEKFKYIFFSTHDKTTPISKTCLSQWYDSSFTENSTTYKTAEHYMMAKKAELFGDFKSLEKILKAPHPMQAKELGREITGFKEELWNKHKFDIVFQGNLLKFSQNQELKEFLINTKQRVLVEASPKDKIWGIGLSQRNIYLENPTKWQGKNLLGFVLMRVRKELLI